MNAKRVDRLIAAAPPLSPPILRSGWPRAVSAPAHVGPHSHSSITARRCPQSVQTSSDAMSQPRRLNLHDHTSR